jgi:hypothetical protein
MHPTEAVTAHQLNNHQTPPDMLKSKIVCVGDAAYQSISHLLAKRNLTDVIEIVRVDHPQDNVIDTLSELARSSEVILIETNNPEINESVLKQLHLQPATIGTGKPPSPYAFSGFVNSRPHVPDKLRRRYPR